MAVVEAEDVVVGTNHLLVGAEDVVTTTPLEEAVEVEDVAAVAVVPIVAPIRQPKHTQDQVAMVSFLIYI